MGVIDAGVFRIEDRIASRLIGRLCRLPASCPQAWDRYTHSLTAAKPDLETVAGILGIAAAYLGNTYLNLRLSHGGLKLGKKRYHSSEDEILAHALES